MISRYEAYMDGIALSSLDPSIYVLNIQYGDVQQSINTRAVAGRPGARIIKRKFDIASVTILFEIHEYDTVKRQAVCSKIQKWADGQILSASDRPGQQLRCVCETYPKVNAKEWTEAISMTFAGYNPPYWENENETIIKTTSSKKAYVPGNAPETLVSATITVGESISSLTVTAGSKSLVLAVSAVQNDKIYIGYDENNILYIKKNTTSILDKRTGDDDLTVPCGEFSTFSVSGGVSAEFKVRGCWH